MPMLIAALGSLFGALLSNLVSKILTLIGFGFIVYQGVKPLYDWIESEIRNRLAIASPAGMPIMEWLGVLRFDVCITIFLSAAGLRLLMMGVNQAGDVKKARLGGGK